MISSLILTSIALQLMMSWKFLVTFPAVIYPRVYVSLFSNDSEQRKEEIKDETKKSPLYTSAWCIHISLIQNVKFHVYVFIHRSNAVVQTATLLSCTVIPRLTSDPANEFFG